MNIFATHTSPIQSAMWLDDKRIVKMILETAQMLSTALRRHGVGNGIHYKSAHQNHPCTLWAGNTRGNFDWLCEHGLAMCHIYTSIYGKIHNSERVIQFAYRMHRKIPMGRRKPFVDCTEFKHLDIDVCSKYKLFMHLKWFERDKREPTWSGRNKPDWLSLVDVKRRNFVS